MIQLLLILIINTLVLIAWGKYLHHLDAFTVDKKNEHKLFWLIIWGGLPSIILTLFIQYRWEDILFALTGLRSSTNPFVDNLLIVGPVEELSKFAVFIALAGIMGSIKEPRDGILQAASVALGFALVENILYAWSGGIILLLIRSILTIVGHMSYAIIWGFTWGAYKYTSWGENKSPDRFYIIPSIFFAAMFHGLYNSLLDYGYPLIAISTDFLTVGLFFLIHRYVRDNSPYKKYSLKEYKQAIPALQMGLNKYPKSYELNKRMGVFNIYTRKYKTAEKYLRTASRISSSKIGGRFYYGVSRYLNGNTTDGIKLMNKAVGDLPTNMRKRPVDSLKNVISSETDRKELLGHFDEQSLQFKMDETRARKNKTATQIRYPLKRKKMEQSKKHSRAPIDDTNSKGCQGTWERLVRVRPGPVILKPYKIGGNLVVNRAGKSYREVLDEKVEEWKQKSHLPDSSV
ncbi:MAG: PrsW family intramembrane metalloprotease [Spirochaetaceae bacterium]|nr:PrsW family intramembrane metalloprotease [Spirochaetaceae bacterium]